VEGASASAYVEVGDRDILGAGIVVALGLEDLGGPCPLADLPSYQGSSLARVPLAYPEVVDLGIQAEDLLDRVEVAGVVASYRVVASCWVVVVVASY